MVRQLRSSLVWYAFIAPTFLLFGLFVVYPTIETFRLSFFREVATRQEFVGATPFEARAGRRPHRAGVRGVGAA